MFKDLAIRKKPHITRLSKVYSHAEFELKKISRKRYIRIIMALGVPAREAKCMAQAVNARGISYKEAINPTLRAIFDVTEDSCVRFWIYIWKIQGFA